MPLYHYTWKFEREYCHETQYWNSHRENYGRFVCLKADMIESLLCLDFREDIAHRTRRKSFSENVTRNHLVTR